MFQKSLEDIVKLTKSFQGDSQSFLSALLNEIKTELSSQDPKTKSNALLKLYFVRIYIIELVRGSYKIKGLCEN